MGVELGKVGGRTKMNVVRVGSGLGDCWRAGESGAGEAARRVVPTAVEGIEGCLLAVCEVWAKSLRKVTAVRDGSRHLRPQVTVKRKQTHAVPSVRPPLCASCHLAFEVSTSINAFETRSSRVQCTCASTVVTATTAADSVPMHHQRFSKWRILLRTKVAAALTEIGLLLLHPE